MQPDDEIDGHLFGDDQMCFGCGPRHPAGFRLSFRREDDAMVARLTPGEQYQGPPNIMHGGLVSTLADEMAAWALVGLRGKFGFTAKMQVTFHHPVRIGEELVARSWIERDRRRVADIEVDIHQGDVKTTSGSFRFVIMDAAGAERLMGQQMTEAWRRFSR